MFVLFNLKGLSRMHALSFPSLRGTYLGGLGWVSRLRTYVQVNLHDRHRERDSPIKTLTIAPRRADGPFVGERR